jgi:site-specific recombinase XerD
VQNWARWCDAADVDPMTATHREVLAWLDERPTWGPAAGKSARSALRSLYQWLREEEVMVSDPMARVPAERQPVRLPRPAAESQVRAGLDAADADTRLMVALGALGGLRRAEIAGLRVADVVAGGVVVRGKGRRERWVPLPPHVLEQLHGRGGDWVFPGRFTGHVHPATVARRVKEAAACSPHPLRHRYASVVHEATGDLLSVRDLLGHASVATTQGYVLLSRARLRAAGAAAWPVDGLLVAA